MFLYLPNESAKFIPQVWGILNNALEAALMKVNPNDDFDTFDYFVS
jgi:hypothetical protein